MNIPFCDVSHFHGNPVFSSSASVAIRLKYHYSVFYISWENNEFVEGYQQTQNICTTFVQRRPNVFHVCQTLYKCYTNVVFTGLCLSTTSANKALPTLSQLFQLHTGREWPRQQDFILCSPERERTCSSRFFFNISRVLLPTWLVIDQNLLLTAVFFVDWDEPIHLTPSSLNLTL